MTKYHINGNNVPTKFQIDNKNQILFCEVNTFVTDKEKYNIKTLAT